MKKVIFIAFVFVFLTSCSLVYGKFDKEKWIADKENVGLNNSRAGMINDLERNYLKIGMNKEKVLEILGDPNGKGVVNDGEVFVYDLGMVMIDNEWYNVFFDKNDKVVRLWREQG